MTLDKHNFRDDIDLDQLHIIGFDHAGTYKHFRDQQTDLYEIILEILANALDSKNLGEPHRITVFRNKHPVLDPNSPILEIKDGGGGIAMDYNNDILELIESLKANSRKPLAKYKIGSKGIGMLQFPNISPMVVFTSMYDDLICRFALVETKEENGTDEDKHTKNRRVGAFTRPKVVAANEKNKQMFDIYENGTKVSFYDRNQNLGWIKAKTLMDKIAKEYAIRFVENDKLEIILNGKSVHAPDEYRDNPPKLLFTTSKGYEVRGNIWANPKGHGNIVMFRGHKVVDLYLDPRQCEGYAECWEIELDSPRTALKDNETTKEIVDRLRAMIKEYPSIRDDPHNKKQMDNVREMASMMLADAIPPMPVNYGSQGENTKQSQQGDLNGTGVLGYKEKKTPDPDRVIKTRTGGPHTKRGEIGGNGTDQVMANTEQQSKRRDENRLLNKVVQYGADKPLMKLFNDRVPALLTINSDNAEYPLFTELFNKEGRTYNLLFVVWMSELYYGRDEKDRPLGLDDNTRFLEGQRRVNMWKMIGRYPPVRAIATAVTKGEIK